MFAVRKAASYSGSTPDRTFRRTAICGNSFTYSQKFCEWHTLVFESQAQNRVHVETASISLRRRSLRYRGAAFEEKYVCKTMQLQ